MFLRLRLLEGGRWYLVPASPPAFPLRLSMSRQERAWNLGGKAGGGAGKIEAPKASFNPPSLGTPRKNSAEGRGSEGGNQFPIAFTPYPFPSLALAMPKSRCLGWERGRGRGGSGENHASSSANGDFEDRRALRQIKAEILSTFLGNFFCSTQFANFLF